MGCNPKKTESCQSIAWLQAKGKKPPDARSAALALLIKMSIMAVASAAQVLVDRTPAV